MIVCYQKILEPGEHEYAINVSRIVGLPGDSIKIRYDRCIINGIENRSALVKKARLKSYDLSYDEYEEEFPNGKKILILHSSSLETEEYISRTIVIPADHFFIMGDHRGDSYDSRYFGPISKDKILGKVIEIRK
jgi:signal peptidase I